MIHNLNLNIEAVLNTLFNIFTLECYIFYYQEETHPYYIHFEVAEKTMYYL